MSDKSKSSYGPNNPHPLSQMRTELVWEGKYDEFGNRRDIDVASLSMPMQRIETIDEPRSRATAQGTLFDEVSAHSDDFRNRLIWGDNKLVLASLYGEFKGAIKLIYIDPPFDIGADFMVDVPIGDAKLKKQKQQSLIEMIAYRDMWGKGMSSYIHMMAERLAVMKELLAEDGTIYIHVGTNVAYLVRAAADDIFGSENLMDEITWKRSHAHGDTGQGAKHFGRVTEKILVYAKSGSATWNAQYLPYTEETLDRDYKYIDEETGERYRLMPVDGPGGAAKGNPYYEFLGVTGYWRYSQETMQQLYEDGEIVLSRTGKSLSRKRYLRDAKGTPITDLWDDVNRISPTSSERIDYPTQKPEALLKRIIETSSNVGDLVADFFVGSGTTIAVAERLNRRWIGSDLGRYSIHTARKRLIEIQRELNSSSLPYRSFDVFNLGRYERQWWQNEALSGAEQEHLNIVLDFFRAEPLPNAASPLIHGRKAAAYVHVDGIDSIFTREEAKAVALAVKAAGGKQVHCLAWDFEMDIRQAIAGIEAELDVKIRLHRIPREIMEKNRTEVPPFFEVALLEAEPVIRKGPKGNAAEIKLSNFLPSLTEVPSKELEALQERALNSGFDFIDFWAIDFDWGPDKPFNHHWQDYRTRKDRSLKTVSDAEYAYDKPGKYTACVKVVDVFGCDTSITVEIEV